MSERGKGVVPLRCLLQQDHRSKATGIVKKEIKISDWGPFAHSCNLNHLSHGRTGIDWEVKLFEPTKCLPPRILHITFDYIVPELLDDTVQHLLIGVTGLQAAFMIPHIQDFF